MWLFALCVAAMLVVGAAGAYLLFAHRVLLFCWLMLVALGGTYATKRVLVGQTTALLIVDLQAQGLHLLWPETRRERTIPFAEIAGYQLEAYAARQRLRLRLADDSRLHIGHADDRRAREQMAHLVRQLEERLLAHRPPAGSPGIVRDKTFIEKPVATVALVLMTVMVLGLTGAALAFSLPWNHNMWLLYMGLGLYAALWYAARERRQS